LGRIQQAETNTVGVPAGPTDSKTAQQQAPDSIRAMYGTDGTRNAAHGSDSPASAAAELAFFFAPRGSNANRSTPTTHCSSSNSSNGGGGAAGGAKNSARCQQTTLGIIKPHAVKDGLAGLLLDSIQASAAMS
jgi:nucleoside-diphosphate kinase